jgi:hypothetical protein
MKVGGIVSNTAYHGQRRVEAYHDIVVEEVLPLAPETIRKS